MSDRRIHTAGRTALAPILASTSLLLALVSAVLPSTAAGQRPPYIVDLEDWAVVAVGDSVIARSATGNSPFAIVEFVCPRDEPSPLGRVGLFLPARVTLDEIEGSWADFRGMDSVQVAISRWVPRDQDFGLSRDTAWFSVQGKDLVLTPAQIRRLTSEPFELGWLKFWYDGESFLATTRGLAAALAYLPCLRDQVIR